MTASTTQAKGKAPRRAAAKPKRSGTQKRENRTGWAFMAPFAVLFTFVFILPIIWAIYSSFFRQVTEGGGAYGGGELVNKFVGFQNFQYAITSGNFWSGVGRVLIYTLIQVPIMIIAALALAIVIDSFVVKHVTGFRLGYFLPYAIPGVVASIIWVYLYNGQISPIVKGLAAIGVNVDFFNKNIVLGSMAMMDYYLTQDSSYNNAEYFVGVLNSVCGKEDSIVIASKDMTATSISATQTQLVTLRTIVVFLIPLAVAAAGIVVFLRRRNR